MVNVGDEYIRVLEKSHVTVSLNDAVVGEIDYTKQGYHTVRWDLTPGPAGPVGPWACRRRAGES